MTGRALTVALTLAFLAIPPASSGLGADARRRAACSRCDAGQAPADHPVERIYRPHQATDRVNLIARVAAFLDERLFTEGAEVKKDDLLYRLEQGPFQRRRPGEGSDDRAVQGATCRTPRSCSAAAKALLNTPAGQQSTVDTALANAAALEAQVLGAEAQLQQSQINLGYTEIRAPIDGKIGRTAVTVGNYVSPELRRARDDREPGSDVSWCSRCSTRSAIDAARP